MRNALRRGWWRLAPVAGGSVLFLEGCDTQTRAAVENGIITASNSLLGAFLRAVIELGTEAAKSDATARAVIDMVHQVFA